MFNWLTRSSIYIRIKPDWLSVRVVRKNGQHSQYEDTPHIVIKLKAKSQPEVLAVGSDAKAFPVNKKDGVSLFNGFDHPRTIISEFDIAQLTLLSFLSKAWFGNDALKSPRLLLSPRLIMHPLDKLEGGLTPVEIRALIELGSQVGARDVIIYQEPRQLSNEEILSLEFDKYRFRPFWELSN